ncbi:RIB43A-like with coiled-coils protein 1 [Chelonoidis abingdonii]|uniref:RIB43A-like with coiled-coils protein 1 n=1 Tax=Chelonoidis abingdonii TaxID=106734 RepID=UPI0013F1D4F4|nr:RIB43A-like with coiled-coils protein 1 [Chelonoidis abingdonii]XP_032626039.1 RIB43A-like with coiled-coils protein 1 [Chelonoidis abingdonii]XP_032626040.1 RIB43A-like with coiled-coils protein 1 [Chelonoidis abingdonii]XP_032626041.1 RIB43A-like with coiled-coils protein 1 [Chelonoidis abingdonii]XP_032626042.1 RIB43A-like with coiled-coils protein 1 [Chelonoidis abingdonii]
MHKVDLPLENKEAAALEARREREKQRLSRIFNARHRTMGVDVEALRSQVEERKLREETEKRRDETYDAERVLCDQVAQMLEEEECQRVRRLHQAVQEFREQQQPPSTRREWDLYNPEGLRQDHPARVSDYDPHCGPASLQRFAGEDLALPTRHQLQQEQQCHSLEEQRAEWQRAMADSKYADMLEDKKRVELDLRAQQLAQLEEECRHAKDLATADYNRAQEAEAAEQHRLAHQQEQDDNQAEIHNHLTGPLLTEDPAVADSPLGPHRILTDRWKGMSPKQVEAMWKAQEEQRQENQRLREAERQREAEWEAQRQLAARAAMVLEEEQRRARLQLRKGLDAYNQQLAQEQRAQQQYLQRELYTNPPSAAYHLQFNTSSR